MNNFGKVKHFLSKNKIFNLFILEIIHTIRTDFMKNKITVKTAVIRLSVLAGVAV
jgi:hypothetical protein